MKRVYKFYEVIANNFHYKVLAFIFTLLLWFLATNKETADAILTLKYTPVPTGDYRVVDYFPKTLKIKVEGYRKEILRLKEEKKVKVYLPDSIPESKGWIKLNLTKEMIKLPSPTINLKKFEPKSIEVKVEKLVKKAVPIQVELSGLKKRVKVKVVPNYAVVSLPEDTAGYVIFVRTEKVDVSDVKLPAVIEVKLKSNYRVEPQKVKIFLEGKDEGKEKAFRNRRN